MTTIVFVHEGLDGMGSPLEMLLYCDVHVVINYDSMSWMLVTPSGNDAISCNFSDAISCNFSDAI